MIAPKCACRGHTQGESACAEKSRQRPGPFAVGAERRVLSCSCRSWSFACHLTSAACPSPVSISDDVTRIEHLQTMPLGELLFRPFNEHVAPVFELVSWVTWQLAGRRLSHAPRHSQRRRSSRSCCALRLWRVWSAGRRARRRPPCAGLPSSVFRRSTSRRSGGTRPAASPGPCWRPCSPGYVSCDQ